MSHWQDVAAAGTDPVRLARVVALCADPAGRRAVGRALGEGMLAPDDGLAALRSPDRAARSAAAEAARRWAARGVRVALRGDPAWPARLGRLSAPPVLLAWRGPDVLADDPAVAIVGARRATSYGTGVAAWLAEAAGRAGATVVSGGALGIDAAAHDAASSHGTVVVLGCGHDVAYPRPHARSGGLFPRVLDGGGALVSELLPLDRPRPQHVRARNRIVAGLVDVVVVVEGGEASGSLVTAGEAADAGIDVLAVPGDVRAPGSAAPHALLRDGAGACTRPEDLLATLRRTVAVAPDGGGQPSLETLPPSVAAVLRESWPRPLRRDELAARAGVGIGTVLAAVTRGRVDGLLSEGPDGVRLARAPGAG